MERLRKALAAEHAAVFAYGLLGARTTGTLRAKVTAAFDAHRARRDALRTLILNRGGKPTEPEASYEVGGTPTGSTAAVNLAVQVEQGIAATYVELAASQEPALRRYAAQAVQESVVRSYGFRPALTAFPGMPVPGVTPTTPSG